MEFTQGVRFDSLGLSPEIMRAIAHRNLEVSTPVQAGCIPPMMAWQDASCVRGNRARTIGDFL